MADMTIKQHDTAPALRATLFDTLGVINLSAATQVKVLFKEVTTGTPSFSGTCTIVNATGGQVSYAWSGGNTAVAGSFNGEFEITWSDSTIMTVPNDSYFTLDIKADLG